MRSQWSFRALGLTVALFLASSALADRIQYVLDSKDLATAKYAVKISGDPLLHLSEEPNEHSRHVTMRNKDGQKYRCLLPERSDDNHAHYPTKGDDESKSSSDSINIPRLLSPMLESPCLLFAKDWWTYEFCHGKGIRQFHTDDGRTPSGEIMNLGTFSHDQEWTTEELMADVEVRRDLEKVPPQKYHRQFYVNGSKCDLTGYLRRTEARFICDPDSSVDTIFRIDEPQSCEYILTILTNKLCSVPALKPPTRIQAKEISCSPLVNDKQYKIWQEFNAAKDSARQAETLKIKKAKENMMFEKFVLFGATDDIIGGEKSDQDEIEKFYGGKIADKLVDTLKAIYPSKDALTEEMTEEGDATETVVDEIRLPSGEMKSIVKNKKPFDATMDGALSKKVKELRQSTEEVIDNLRSRVDDYVDEVLETAEEEGIEFRHLGRKKTADLMSRALDEISEELDSKTSVDVDDILSSSLSESDTEVSSNEEDMVNDLDKEIVDFLEKVTAVKDKKMTSTQKKAGSGHLHHSVSDDSQHSADSDNVDKESDKNDDYKGEEDGEEMEEKTKRSGDKGVIHLKVSHLLVTSDEEEDDEEKTEDKHRIERIVKQLESTIKEKLFSSGIEFGGREVEVKISTPVSFKDILADDGDNLWNTHNDGRSNVNDIRNVQSMMYNLMIGNNEAYKEIKGQRQSEINYGFSLDDELVESWTKELSSQNSDLDEAPKKKDDSSIVFTDTSSSSQEKQREFVQISNEDPTLVGESGRVSRSKEKLDVAEFAKNEDVTAAQMKKDDKKLSESVDSISRVEKTQPTVDEGSEDDFSDENSNVDVSQPGSGGI